MATVKLVLNRDREKKRGGFSLVVQVIHKRSRRVIYTPYTLFELEFDSINQKIIHTKDSRFTTKEVKEMNDFVAKKIREIHAIIDRISQYKKEYEVSDIVWKYEQEKSNRFLILFLDKLIKKKEFHDKMGTAKALRSTKHSLERFLGNREMLFADIDYTFIKSYEAYLYDTGVVENTVSFYLRNLRTIYNLASDSGVDMVNTSPFRKVHISNGKTVKRAIKLETLRSIARADLLSNPPLDRARDLFMFSFYCRGMSFVDIIYLKHSDIKNGIIRYYRQKTRQYIQITITKPLQYLIDKYAGDPIYVLPFINEIDRLALYDRYQITYASLYRQLYKLEKYLGLSIHLTTYVARHSWATIAKEQGVPVSVISEGLGHTNERTTGIYLKEFDTSIIDGVNDKIIGFL